MQVERASGGPQGFYALGPLDQCSAVPFKFQDSTTFRKTDKSKFIQYGRGAVEGHISSDTIWVDKPGCRAQSMQFLAVEKVYDQTLGTDGILGMSPVDESSGPLLMTALNKQGQLPNYQFSILLSTRPEEKGYLTWGGYETSMFKPSLPIWTHYVTGSFHWQLHLVRVTLGRGPNQKSFLNYHSSALTDTGTTMLYAPERDWVNVFNMFCEGKKCGELSDGFYIANCDPSVDLEPLVFQIDSIEYTVTPEFYAQRFKGKNCFIGIGKNPA